MVVGQSPGITAGQHGREELDADHQPDDEIAEAEFVVDEQRNDRQRQADGEITAEERRDDAGRGTGQVNRRGVRPDRTVCSEC